MHTKTIEIDRDTIVCHSSAVITKSTFWCMAGVVLMIGAVLGYSTALILNQYANSYNHAMHKQIAIENERAYYHERTGKLIWPEWEARKDGR